MVNAFRCHIHALQKRVNSRVNSTLGTDEIVDIHFIDGHFPARLGFSGSSEDIASHPVGIPCHPATFPDKETSGIDDAAAEQF